MGYRSRPDLFEIFATKKDCVVRSGLSLVKGVAVQVGAVWHAPARASAGETATLCCVVESQGLAGIQQKAAGNAKNQKGCPLLAYSVWFTLCIFVPVLSASDGRCNIRNMSTLPVCQLLCSRRL